MSCIHDYSKERSTRPPARPPARRAQLRQPLDASDHWSNRLTTVPTKSSLVRQELFIEEAKAKFKAKKLLHSTMGDKNE